jgi:PD-(D/E)XK nuclease superfamily
MKLSRSAIESSIRCPRCFFLERKMGLKPPAMVPLTLAVATDALLKNDFDAIRGTDRQHPVWELYGLSVRAFCHPDLDLWRSNFKGVRITHSSGVDVYGAVDDIWQNLQSGELHVVDYKSTSKKDVPSLEGGFGDSYKRQMEIYQWLLRKAGHRVSDTGYFLYVNGKKDRRFYCDGVSEGRMAFETTLITYSGNDNWVEAAVERAIELLHSNAIPDGSSSCDSCRYFRERRMLEPVI